MRYFILLISTLGIIACSRTPDQPAGPVNRKALTRDSLRRIAEARFQDTRTASAGAIREIIETREPDDRYKARGVSLYSSVLLPKLYIENNFNLLWINHFDSIHKVEEMSAFLEDIIFHGLIPEHYHAAEIRQSLTELAKDSALIYNSTFLANLDLLLSDAWFMAASHLYFGKIDPESLEAQWGIRRDKPDIPFDRYLKTMLSQETVEEGFRHFYPPHPGYEAMVAEAKRLTTLKDGDFSIKADLKNSSLKPGDSSAYIAEIKRKLAFLGLYTPDTLTNPDKYDDRLLESVKKLQEHFGYNTDGAIGKNAFKALNMTVEQRIGQLYVNMERLRWMPDSLEHTYIQVNIADFTLDVFREGDTLLRMRTIVGKEYRETPVFNARITYLVFSPSWTVPPTIQRKDVIPEVRRNTGYLARKNMKVYDSKGRLVDPASVNWSRDGMRYTIRQSPGAQNALGKVKFMFPNKHNIYLHDTPSRNLFARDERTFSSGCIRIEKPYDLALILMSDMEGWTPERIRQAMDAGIEKTVVLKNPAGVYLTYLTAWGTKAGVIHYRTDIYNRDAEMLKALREKHTKWKT
ncbi:murein L,D-transpeptidase YcbB/YkuD [Lentimicrobium saccharophilum]|uniref:Murein L,D-transpeptidase YcbB/YkuD n=1 Tax=Lentimicrobium saccharophilum TaxID=1678841 RepID=A0A0S7BS23_9BACT|nr:L,D-transpeptidase family protein [Lentimicrobium saccharophilum]GAP43562.1 murein L,D-transpeptidase YcbB/YkuD [Lentimicrobium saccharophilum]